MSAGAEVVPAGGGSAAGGRGDAAPSEAAPSEAAAGGAGSVGRGPVGRGPVGRGPGRGGPRPRASLLAKLCAAALLIQALVLLAVLAALRWAVDVHWAGTLLAFGPRWVFALSPPALLLVALWTRRGALVGVAVASIVVAFVWILDASFGLGREGEGTPIRIVTQNLGQAIRLDDPRFARLLSETRPDVLLVQECWRDEEPKTSPDPAYHLVVDFSSCILSRFPILRTMVRPKDDVWARGGAGDVVVFEIQGPDGSFFVASIQLETPREGFEALLADKLAGVPKVYENIELRRWESEIATAFIDEKARRPLIVAGDFNMPAESAIYRRYWGHLANAWGRCGRGWGWTKRTRKIGARIDHVVFDDAWGCADAHLAPDVGSDHLGLVADLRLRSSTR